MSYKSPASRVALLCFVILGVIIGLGGCGGGGGTGTTSTTSTTSTTATGYQCFADYTPNYSNDIKTSTNPNVEGSFYGWAKLPIKVYFPIDANWTQARQDATTAGFDGWAATMGFSNFYVLTSTSSDALMTVTFNDSLGTGVLGVTEGSVNSSTQLLTSCTMKIWKSRTLPQIQQTAAHEFGHAMGMFGHSPDSLDLMYYAATPLSPDLPTLNDRNTLKGNYCNNFFSRAPARAQVWGEPEFKVRIVN